MRDLGTMNRITSRAMTTSDLYVFSSSFPSQVSNANASQTENLARRKET
jgi:hypothetical protein